MIVLHGAIANRSLFIWGERKFAFELSDGAAHSFACEWNEISAAIASVLPNIDEDSAVKAVAKLSLPTGTGSPLPSTTMLVPDDVEIETADAKYQLWDVPGVMLGPSDLPKFIRISSGSHVLSPGVILGNEFAFFDQTLQLAGSMVVRQKYFPSVVVEHDSYIARWEPLLERDDRARLAVLTSAAPPVVRSLRRIDDSNVAADHDPTAAALALMLDTLVRQTKLPPQQSRGFKLPKANKSEFDSVHDCWISALMSNDGLMHYDKNELRAFKEQIDEWHQRITALHSAPFRLCFRLDEPIESENLELSNLGKFLQQENLEPSWSVTYWLQGSNDPSLIIPVREAWQNKSTARQTFAAQHFNPREFLLRSLGQAARLSPDIASSLSSKAPEGFTLDTSGAFDFLSEKSPALEQSGFGVMLPSWWMKRGGRSGLRMSAAVKSSTLKSTAKLSHDTIVQFDWKVAIGDVGLSLAELEALAKLKTPLIKVRGQWVQVSADEIRAAIAYLKKKANAVATVGDVIRLSFGSSSPIDPSQTIDIEASGWIAELLSQLQEPSKIAELPEPEQFIGQLRPYQKRGYSWLAYLSQWGFGACLADDMGLGKTVQTLAMVQQRRVDGEKQPVLLVCPTSVVNNWKKESARFTPQLKVHVHHGSERAKGPAFKSMVADKDMVISSYSLLHRDLEHLREIDWSGLVLDEAQNIKNPETKQSFAARELNSRYRVALTGTPVENNIGDLWSIMEFLNRGLLGSQTAFRKNFFYPIQVEHNPDALKRLQRITQPFILRRLKTDKSIITDLPDKQEMKVYCSLTKEQVSLYSAVLKDLDERLSNSEGIERKGLILATLAKLKQVCNHPAQFLRDNAYLQNRSGKLQRLSEMLDEARSTGDKVLIFSQFKEMGDIIRRHFEEDRGEEVLFLHGGVSKKKRDRMVEQFQSGEPGPSIFILSLKAGGTGLNLTAANHVFHFDRWWNPAVENQASDRAFRIGQTKNVQIHKFICAGTLEEKIDDMIESKRQLAQDVVGTGEAWLTELSNSQLKEVFALSKEALTE
jgi:SNF2 family DNA or RNA helicase